MKKLLIFSFLIVWIQQSIAQDSEQEWTTYYAEKVGFQIDVPDDWASGFSEVKGVLGIHSAALTSVKEVDGQAWTVVLISTNYKPKGLKMEPPIEQDLKWWKKRSEKNAKKSADPAYQWIGQSTEAFPDENVEMAWIEYIYTFVLESGEETVSRTREVFFYLKPEKKLGSPRYRVKVNFISPVDDWDEAWKEFENIVKSFAPYTP